MRVSFFKTCFYIVFMLNALNINLIKLKSGFDSDSLRVFINHVSSEMGAVKVIINREK